LNLARKADMIVHNMRPAAMARFGLDYEAVAAVHPGIIYLELVGFDQRGPYAAMPAYDDVIQGACGLASLHGLANGQEPTYMPVVIVDRVCGIHAAQVALAALLMKQRTGQGQRVQVPMFETMVQLVMGDHMGGETFVPPAGPIGYQRLLTRDRRPYRSRDGYVALLIYTDRQWERFLDAIGERELLKDERFSTAAARAQNYDVIYPLLTQWLQERSTIEWIELLQRLDIPCMPLGDPQSLLENEHLNAIDFFSTVEHPSEGRIRSMRVVSRWSGAEVGLRHHAPRPGEQSISILREAGIGEEYIDRLLQQRVVVQA
jgi:crotonobetainyl-CoA:carnitine CoA-transferase CaiB-like acyl-CoA transferase